MHTYDTHKYKDENSFATSRTRGVWSKEAHTCNPRILELQQGGYKFKASLGYIRRPNLQKKELKVFKNIFF